MTPILPKTESDPPSGPRLSGPRVALAALGFLLVLGTLSFRHPLPSFGSADNGFKWWQARTFAENGFGQGTLAYSLIDIDPEGRFQPLGSKYGRMRGDRLEFAYSPWWALLLTPFAEREAFRAALLLVALMGAVVLVLCAGCGARLGLRFPVSFALAFSLFSPMVVYSLEPNEHTLALALGMGAWLLILPTLAESQAYPQRGFAVGALCALAALVRNEYGLWGFSLALLALFSKRWRISATVLFGLAGGLALGLALQSWFFPTTEMVRGTQVHAAIPQTSWSLFYLHYRWALLNHWLFSAGHYREAEELALSNPLPWGLFAMLLATFALGRAPRAKGTGELADRGFACGVLLLGWALLGVWYGIVRAGLPHVSGLFLVFPILSLLLLLPVSRLREDRAARQVLLAAGMQFALVLLLAGNSRGGRQWGPRYLMVIWPLLAALGWRMIEEILVAPPKWRWLVTVPLLLASLLAVGAATRTVWTQQDTVPLDLLRGVSHETPDGVFLTDLEYLPGAAVGTHHRHWMVFPSDTSEAEKRGLASRLLESRGGFVWVSRRGPEGFLPPHAEKGSEQVENGFLIERYRLRDEKTH